MKGRELEWGPVTVITGNAGPRRIPKARLSRIEPTGQVPYLVGFWVSWLGGQVSVCRNRWYQREATWWHQFGCLSRRVLRRPAPPGWTGGSVHGHNPVTIVTRAALDGATPDTAMVRILDSHVACRRCGLILKGAKWVNR